ncbi:MAG: SBBP repeat-containing protein [bacterium]
MTKNIFFFFIILILSFSCENKKAGNIIDDDILDDKIFENSDNDDYKKEECSGEEFKWDYVFKDLFISKIREYKDDSFISLGSYTERIGFKDIYWSMVSRLNNDFTSKWVLVFDQIDFGTNFNDFYIGINGEIFAVGTKYVGDYINDSFVMVSINQRSGEVLWRKEWQYCGLKDARCSDAGHNVLKRAIVSDDGIFVSGFTAGWDDEGFPSYTLVYLAKTDMEGELVWEKILGPRGSMSGDMKIDSEGNLYITGYTTGDLDGKKNPGRIGACDGLYQFGPVGESTCPTPFIIKTDGNGETIWSDIWGTDSPKIEAGVKILLDETGEVYVFSSVASKNGISYENLEIRKYREDGKLVLKRYLDIEPDFLLKGTDMVFDKYGHLILIGYEKEVDVTNIMGTVIVFDKDSLTVVERKTFSSYSHPLYFSLIYDRGVNYDIFGFFDYLGATTGILKENYFNDISMKSQDIMSGDVFERETIQAGSKKDDEIVFSFIDKDGNVFVVGNTWDNIGGAKNKGEKDVFVAKYKADGTLEWSRNFGSDNWDNLKNGSVDSHGNIILAGTTRGDFEGNERLGEGDVFVMKVDSDGNLVWVTISGSETNDWLNDSWVGSNGDIYITGGTFGSFEGERYYDGFGSNAFVGIIKSDGTKKVFKLLGPRVEGTSIVNAKNETYVAGRADFAYADQTVYQNGKPDTILFKLDKNLEEQWARIWGSVETDSATGVAVDSLGDIYVTGYTFGAIDKNIYLGADCPGGFCPDAYLTKWDNAGKKQWTRQFGTEYGDRATSIAIDENDEIYISGTARKNRLCEIESDIFLIKSDTSGNLGEMKIWGTAGEEKVNSISISNGKIIISGHTTGGLDGNKNEGGKDGFVTVINKEDFVAEQ